MINTFSDDELCLERVFVNTLYLQCSIALTYCRGTTKGIKGPKSPKMCLGADKKGFFMVNLNLSMFFYYNIFLTW
jgi:hypothetical protein